MSTDVSNLNRTDDSNIVLADGGSPELMDRSDVNDQVRGNMGGLRRWYEDAEWVDLLVESGDAFTVSRVDATTFRVTDVSGEGTDATSKFQALGLTPLTGMWVRVTGTSSPTVAFGTILTIGPYSDPNLDIVLEGIIDGAYASSTLPDTTVTKVEIYFGRRIRGAAFRKVGATLAQTPQEIPSIDDLGDGAALDQGSGNGFDADTVDTKHWSDILTAIGVNQRNALLNGGMQVWQRGTTIDGASEYPNDTDSYCADAVLHLTETDDRFDITRERTELPAGFRNALRMTAVNGAATEQAGFAMFADGESSRPVVGDGEASLSFYAFTQTGSTIANMRAAIIGWRSTEDVLTSAVVAPGNWNGGGSDPTLAANWFYESTPSSLALVANAWTRYTIAAGAINASDVNLAALIWIDDDVYTLGDYVIATGVQLEAGDVATAFKHRSFAEEMALCQERAYSSYNHGTAPGTATDVGRILHPISRGADYPANDLTIPLRFPVRMRGTPSVVVYSTFDGATGMVDDGAGTNITAAAIDAGEMGVAVDVTGNPTQNHVGCHIFASSDL